MTFWIRCLLGTAILSLQLFILILSIISDAVMSFFSSLRRRTNPTDESEGDQVRKTPTLTRRRALTAWSLTPRRRKSIPWELQMSKRYSHSNDLIGLGRFDTQHDVEKHELTPSSEEDSDDKTTTTEENVYPKYDPHNPDHTLHSSEQKQSNHSRKSDTKPRGRSFSWTKTSPFSGFRTRSRSRSQSELRSSSPSRSFFHKAAELVKAPAALFYKDRVSEDSGKPLMEQNTTPKSVRPKKSVHFSPGDDEDEAITKSSPIPIPGKLAPSLPPVEVSTLGSMTLGIETAAVLTARPPATPLIKACVAQALDALPVDTYLGLPVTAINYLTHASGNQNNPHLSISDPFDDKAEIQRHADAPKLPKPVQTDQCDRTNLHHIVEARTIPEGNAGKEDEIASKLASTAIVDVTSSTKIPPPEVMIRAQTLPHPTTRQPLPFNKIRLPLRPKRSANNFMHDGNAVFNTENDDKLRTTGYNATFSSGCDAASATETVSDSATQPYDGKVAIASVGECTERLRNMSIEDDIGKLTISTETQLSPEYTEDNAGITGENHSASFRNSSRSPLRRKFRFENRADAYSTQQPAALTHKSLDKRYTPVRSDTDNSDRYESVVEQTPVSQASRLSACTNVQTPSPSKVPLPPSVRPSEPNILLCQAHTFRDQHGWSPFAEERFPEAALDIILGENGDQEFARVLCDSGGFSRLWRIASLPQATAPSNDSVPPSLREAEILMDAIIGWAHHRYNVNPNEPLITMRQKTPFPIKYFKRRDGDSNKGGFFAPITTFDDNKSSEALSEATRDISLDSSEDTATQTNRSPSNYSADEECQQPGCTCSPCECVQCDCGSSEGDEKCSRPGCTCSPCECAQCDCGSSEEEDQHLGDNGTQARFVRYQRSYDDRLTLSPIREAVEETRKFNSRVTSAESEPDQKMARKFPSIGSVPLRYYNGGSADSRVSFASDTSIDEEEAYCAGLV